MNRDAARIAAGRRGEQADDGWVRPLFRQHQRDQRRQGTDLDRLAQRGCGVDRGEGEQAASKDTVGHGLSDIGEDFPRLALSTVPRP